MKNILIIAILLISQLHLYAQDELYSYPEILDESLNGLSINEDEWISEQFFCNENENFILIKQVQDRIIAISVDETEYPSDFYLCDIGLNREVNNKILLKDADYGIVNRNNLQLRDGQIHFFVSANKKEEFMYDMSKAKYSKAIPQVIDWDRVEDWQSDYLFSSPEKNYQIELSDAELIFIDFDKNISDTLISQEYDGEWSFGTGFWSKDETRFYFDNSGAQACIWELDLEKKTINKIVPDHLAKQPILINDDQTMKIMYCLEGCIMIAKPKE